MKKEAANERIKRRAQRMQEAQTPGQRARRERNNRLLCIISGVLCYAAVLMIMLDAVAPQKYRVEPGEVSRSTITATKDVMDQVSYEAACKAARDSVSAIYRIDDEKRVSVINAVTDDFAKVEDARAQAIAQRNDWLKENPGSTAEQHQFPSAFINMLIGNLNISCSAEEMLVIINTNQQDIESVAAFIKTRINSIMASGLSEEELIGERNAIAAALNNEYSTVSAKIKTVAERILEKELVANYSLDETATDEAKLAAAAEVSQGSYLYKQGQTIVRSGDIVTQAHIAICASPGRYGYISAEYSTESTVSIASISTFLGVCIILGSYTAI